MSPKKHRSVAGEVISRIPTIVLGMTLIFLWSSSTTIFTGNIVHLCVSSRKLNHLYCLSATRQAYVKVRSNSQENIVKIDYELEQAKETAKEQMRVQRNWVAGSDGNHTGCEKRGIYVYDLPAKFNKDLLSQCGEMLPWMDFCKHLQNGAKGERISQLGDGWYETHQYALEIIFHERILNHRCRVFDEEKAEIFYVPYYGGLDILRWHFRNVSSDVKDSLGLDLITFLKSRKAWVRNNGKDHVFVLGKISWDFRRHRDTNWGTKFLILEEMQSPVKLLIERIPWEINDVGIPHPTYFHPKSDWEIVNWQKKVERSRRTNLVSFAGAARPKEKKSIRSWLIEQCVSAKNCKFLDCNLGGCDQSHEIINLFLESEFCLQPPGDSPTRKSVFDSLVAGCIPVVFDPFTAYYQYPWHLPEEHEKYSVFIDQEDVRAGKVNVVERLMNVSLIERESKRKFIVDEMIPGLIYGDSDSKFDRFRDAFGIAVDNLLERVKKM